MTVNSATMASSHSEHGISTWMTILLAAACGLIAANLYYAQPLIGLIATDIGLHQSAASMIVALTQIGYCTGLLLLVPLGDLTENRRLISLSIGGVVLALLLATVAPTALVFLTASLLIGLSAVAVQMLVPLAAHMAHDANRGRVVGNVMSGLLLGIMLSRPASSLIAHTFGWRAVFGTSAVIMIVLLLVLRRLLPPRRPSATHTYGELIASLWALLRDTPILRRRAAYQAALFASFTLFWTIVPQVLSGPQFGFTQRGIALFALSGAAGVFSAPIAGRMADHGWSRLGTGLSLALVAIGLIIAHFGANGSVILLMVGGILLDLGVQSNLVLGQRAIYSLGVHTRSRLNGLYMALFFAGGAFGSAISSYTFIHGGWELVSWVGLFFPVAAMLFYATEFIGSARQETT
jgi:predicted MFS family arabinose efflux permease